MKKYEIMIGDRGGVWGKFQYDTWAEVLEAAVVFNRRFRDKCVAVFTLDMCDYDTNGLSERQRDTLAACGM